MSPNTTPSAPTITARRTASAPPAVRGGDTGSDVVCTVRSSFSSRTLSSSDWMRYGRVAAELIDRKLAMTVRAQSQLQRSPVRRRDHIPKRSEASRRHASTTLSSTRRRVGRGSAVLTTGRRLCYWGRGVWQRGSPMRLVGVQIVEQALHGGAHLVEGLLADNGRPLR